MVAWSGQLVLASEPHVAVGYKLVFVKVSEPDFQHCPTGTAMRAPTFPGLGVAPAIMLGHGYDERGCAFTFAIAFDQSHRLCFQQVFSSGGSGYSGCEPMKLDATTRVAEFNVESFGCTDRCRRQFVGFVGPGVASVGLVEPGTDFRPLPVKPLTDAHFRALGIAGYVQWSDPESAKGFPAYTGYDDHLRVLWMTDELGRVQH